MLWAAITDLQERVRKLDIEISRQIHASAAFDQPEHPI
jgi:hypothetical protein